MRTAGSRGAAVVAFLASAGARIQEGAAALGSFGRIFFENVALSGRVLQISIITGPSAGDSCYSPALTDFIVMTNDPAMFLTGPKVVRQALGEDIWTADLGGPAVRARNGVSHFTADDDAGAVAIARDLLEPDPSMARPAWSSASSTVQTTGSGCARAPVTSSVASASP